MRGNLILTDSRDYLCIHDFSLNTFDNKFNMTIYVDENIKLDDQLNNKEEFIESVDEEKKIAEDLGYHDEKLDEIVEYIKNNFDKLFDSVDEISLDFEETDYLEFIKNNPIVLSKKLIICENIEINDYDKTIELINKYRDIMDKVYVNLDNNSEPISIKDCYKTIKAIKEMADSVSRLGLSPIETIMYVYDQVRNRVYKYEDKGEKLNKSRDLTEVLFSDKIVCLGYANVMSAILSYLEIENNMVRLIDRQNKKGHARNAIYVNDPKYDIDGVYYFDATWDSKKEENDNSYLNSYKYFAKTKACFDEKSSYEETYLKGYSEDLYEIIEKLILLEDYEKVKSYYGLINHMFKMNNIECPVNLLNFVPDALNYGKFNKEEFLSQFKDICRNFTKEIPAETMINILYNVRKIEYYQNPEWYPFDANSIFKTYIKSGWNLKGNAIIELLNFTDSKEVEKQIRMDIFRRYAFNTELFEKIQEVRFTKVLRNVLEKKKK